MRTSLVVGRLERVPVSVTLSPGLTMLALITDALSGRARGAPEPWRQLVRSAAGAQDAMVVRSLASPGFSVLPDVVLPGEFTRDLEVPEQVEMLRDLPPDLLLSELEAISGGPPAPHWRGAVDNPRRWLGGYADLLQAAWSAMSPLWRRMLPVMEREVERVAVAAARRCLDVVLDDLHVGCRYQEDVLSFPDVEPETFTIGSRSLVLMPMLAGQNALIARLDGPGAVWIGYPLPGLTAAPAPERQRPDLLRCFMGEARAAILTCLDRPLTMGALGRRVQHAPNMVSYHCDRLESAGLITRVRQGREIYVRRTARAQVLIDLFST
ncbi:winged helix-turn-helix domain-containing protein [Nonomuraea sp. NPDC050790]|uniref:winged helix-turn-helix domain-containing protein n=1 Tax=Nonomuraea sp. NPDC050790 TaxID=3364371 RepID=UPI00378DDB96